MPLSRLDKVPEQVAEYPEFSMFGELPAWGFYVRHVEGLMMKNIKLSIDAPDYRPSLVFDNVREVTMQTLKITGDSKTTGIVLYQCKNLNIDSDVPVLRK